MRTETIKDNLNRVIQLKIFSSNGNHTWSYLYDDLKQIIIETRTNAPFYKIVRDLKNNTSKLIWVNGKEEFIT